MIPLHVAMWHNLGASSQIQWLRLNDRDSLPDISFESFIEDEAMIQRPLLNITLFKLSLQQ